ncbi:Cysteine-rich RLK (receptor-like protein kinase) 8 [Cucumis melo var. makuwa]|uniref:Cysteine-rich RLK (Receptor-like protein kinase) 8 n=1 Tax=Cucumis melo var. makuwa TaxID=1194695 RepID=A0A5D3CVL8_CUCMM|nr:Cysteine-rich RLK (receptor-like protein kinase) 8 [Cucumis melo var. makuwa]TYK15278.1 Cysteine-rich RLK (receptor-like protein kinase) 8 [Cucumis melo var. makuwa]
MENPTEPCTNNTMSENDRFDVAVLENVEEKDSGDETEVRTETCNNEAKQGHIGKINEYDHSLDLPIALRKALKKNNTWEIYTLPNGHNLQGCKWVFTLKYKADGTLDRHKARLVAKGFTQTYGVDYSETFSPVAKLNIVRVLLSVATTFVKSQQTQRHSDHTLFTKVSKTGKIAILIVYVDDIVLSRDDQTEISQLKQRMGNEFKIKDLRNLKYFLGMEVTRSKEGIFMSQRKYIIDLLTETGMLGCYPADTSIEFNYKLRNFDDQVPVDEKQYQCLVDKLIYLSHTRPDISFAVSVVSQFM